MALDNFNRILVGKPRTDEPEKANGPVVTYHLSPEEIARLYGPPVPVKKNGQKRPIMLQPGKPGIAGRKPKEECTMEAVEQVQEKQAEAGFETYEPQKKTRLEIAREKLSKEKYLELKDEGLKDKEIMEQLEIPNDVFYTLKKEWGLTAQGKKMTIAKAVEIREEMMDEMACAENLLKPDYVLADGVKKLLQKHFDECSSALQKIEKVFAETEIEV